MCVGGGHFFSVDNRDLLGILLAGEGRGQGKINSRYAKTFSKTMKKKVCKARFQEG